MSNVVALPTRSCQITLHVTDPEVLHELERREAGPLRESFAAQALRLGVLAQREASGSLDADAMHRQEGEVLGSVAAVLQQRKAANEFSLDTEEVTRSRLVAPVESTRGLVGEQLSFDFEGTATQQDRR